MTEILRIRGGGSSCYLLKNGKDAVLVDTGVKRYSARILEPLRGLDVRLILLTHGHIDHTQNAMHFSRLLGVPVAIHPNDETLLKNNTLRPVYARSFLGYNLKGASEKSFARVGDTGVSASVFLRDGQTLAEYGLPDCEVLLFGGHTRGSIGIKTGGSLVCGDIIMNFLRPAASLIAEDFAELDAALSRIGTMEIKTLYPGHGKPVSHARFFKNIKAAP